MNTQERTLWVAYTNSDLTEGRGHDQSIATCRIEATAIRLAKKRYVMGTDGPVRPTTLLLHEGKWYAPVGVLNIVEPTEEDARAQHAMEVGRKVLAKARDAGLTEDEIKILKGMLP